MNIDFDKEDFQNKMEAALLLMAKEWDGVAPRDVVVAFMALWKIAQEQPAMRLVWTNIKVRMPRFTRAIEEAWPEVENDGGG